MAHLQVIGVEWCGGDSVVTDVAEESMAMPFYYSGIEKQMQCLPTPRQQGFEKMHAFCLLSQTQSVDMGGRGDREIVCPCPYDLWLGGDSEGGDEKIRGWQ